MATMPTFEDFQVLPAAQLNAISREVERVVAATFGDLTRTNRPLFTVRRTSSQTISVVTDTVVVWQTYEDDPDGMWDPEVPSRITVNRGGVWLVLAQQRYPISASGDRAAKIMLNGTSVFDDSIASWKGPARNDGEGTTLALSRVKRLAAGDSLYLNTWQSASTAQDLDAASFGGTWFSGVWLGP